MENENNNRIVPINITDEMKESFIAYAMSVITSRALPDVRDGLKPVHRRILFAMNGLGLQSSSKFRKSATVVGEVLGKYHPHGDTSVYDAMVNLAQDFSTRYPMVWGQGNFGSIDGDSPAAMRYTEAKMQKVTAEMLRDIEKDTVAKSSDPLEDVISKLQGSNILKRRLKIMPVVDKSGAPIGQVTRSSIQKSLDELLEE